MSATKVLLTAEEFDRYPFAEDKRYELDEGELIEMTRPAYKHNRILRILVVQLSNHFEKHGGGEALLSENLYALSSTTRRAPDVAVILGDREAELRDAKVITIIPEIAIEVLSPSETAPGTHRKVKQYFQAGVKEVWLIYPESKEAEVWTGTSLPDRTLVETDSLESALLPGFTLPLAGLFS